MEPDPQSPNSLEATILLVDDTPENLALLGEILRPTYQVRATTTGSHALRLATAAPQPDLILLDIMMPEMDGYTVLTSLKEDPTTGNIPVIFVTAMDDSEDEQRGLALGAVDYITKPFLPAIVLARVRTHLELKRARDRLRDQNTFLEAEVARRTAENELILATAGEGIYGTDLDGVINFINPAAAAILGYPREELLGRAAHAVLHRSKPDGSPYPREECPVYASLVAGSSVQQKEDIFQRKDGTPLPVELSSMPMVKDGTVLGAVVTFMDISERKRYLAQLERQSNFDDLTGLPNRNLLTDRLSHAIERCRQETCALAVLVLSLNRFKEINDNLGRSAGNQLLKEMARRLGDVTDKANTLAHTERDEFVLVAEIAEESGAAKLAQPILSALSQPFVVGEHEFVLSAAIGIGIYPKDGKDSETLLNNAVTAMYHAKAEGSGFRYYAGEMNARSLARLDMENGLRRALQEGELVVHYQPQLNLRNGEIIGAEALVRWQHPQHGLLPPMEFIPLAEETGLIMPLGEWVMRTACAQNKAWQEAGLPAITVAVNLSARQVAAQDMVNLAGQILRETGLDPQFLELELTESAVMADADAFTHATEMLKGLSLTLSIDDFGTGFSSLSYLKRLSIDRLKIDQSFVRDITHDPDSAAIAVAIITLAHSLNLAAVAEGVETEGQLIFLRDRGCDEMQGFHFSKALPAEEFEQLLRDRRKLVFPSESALPERTLLLVDDEASILSSLKRQLRREGYNILTAQSGLEALELMASHEVGVVLSDARMAQMGGAEFLGKVREIHPDCVRIMLSGYTDLKAVTEAVNTGNIFKFLTKPWDDAELQETLREAFRYYEGRRQCRLEVPQVGFSPRKDA